MSKELERGKYIHFNFFLFFQFGFVCNRETLVANFDN